jgi:putative heme-binding domain-containing protein
MRPSEAGTVVFQHTRGALTASFVTMGIAVALLVTFTMAQSTARATVPKPHWIWLGKSPGEQQTIYLRKEVQVPEGSSRISLVASCDNAAAIFIDGKKILETDDWQSPIYKEITSAFVNPKGPAIKAGRHILAAQCRNQGGPAGFAARVMIEGRRGSTLTVVSDSTWRATDKLSTGWTDPEFNDQTWPTATELGPLGSGPWASVTEATFTAASQRSAPSATPGDKFKVANGFRVDLLYTVPKDEQGSWVNMTVDPKGRLIVSDQYGKLYRVILPSLGGIPKNIQVEPISVDIGEAQGLLWAFDSLYVVVNRGRKYPSGLYRVSDTDGDDRLDKVETLRLLNGAGEHGPHAVVLSPDGKSLYVVAGNATRLTELSGSLVPRIYDEDQILPYLPDGRGFMRDERAPGGCIYRVDPQGKQWELVSMGYRNPYDLAFNKNGDLFTYDSDMEWDINTPWYRPTRVCLAASGSDLGYRNGSGKWPTYYPDSLPPVLNIGPGSPTGVAFGYGAKFPSKYQEALYLCDWSYGKLYAAHLTPDSSSYKAEVEEFVSGQPLPLTDVVVNPVDQAMYFTTGGRQTLSGLYRVTYVGSESTEPYFGDRGGEALRAIRRNLEAFHGRKDASAVEAAWPYLGHSDRFIRFAARVAIEHQDPTTWQERALEEKDPQASLTALLALARAGDKSFQFRLIEALNRLTWESLSVPQQLELLRAYELALIRMGQPDESTISRLIARFDAVYPSKVRELNAELSKILVKLQSPSVAAKTIALLGQAPTQEEQLDYASSLRRLRAGWTPELHKAYFSWFSKGARYRGGASFTGFLREIRDEAITSLSEAEKLDLKPLLQTSLEPSSAPAAAPPRPFVTAWTVDELAPLVERGLAHRDFDRGRSLFAAASCFACHRFNNEGGTVGPDLTGAAGRFSPRDLLESIVLPSKSISDQYQAVIIATTDGRVVTGRVVNLHGDTMHINTNMLDPSTQTNVNQRQVEVIKPSPVSMMPEGLLNTLNREEVLDLVAYLLSGGNREHASFR